MIQLTKTSETASKISFSYAPVPGCIGYVFYANDQRVSNTWDPLKSTVTFGKIANGRYRVDAVGVEDSGVYPPTAPPPPPAGKRGIGYLRLGDGALRSNPEKYDRLLITQNNLPLDRDYGNEVLTYYSLANCSAAQDNGVLEAEARANGWLLKDASGNEIINRQYPLNKLGDIGNPDYVDRFCERVLQQLPGFRATGFYNDDCIGFNAMWWNSIPAKYPTKAAWTAAWEFAAARMREKLPGVGLYHNCHDFNPGDPESNTAITKMKWWNRIAPFSDGLMVEYWMYVQGTLRRSGTAWNQGWETWRDLHRFANGEPITVPAQFGGGVLQLQRPIQFIGLDEGSSSADDVQRYCLATYLLDAKSGSMFIWNATDSGDPWMPEYDKLPLVAAAPATKTGNVWSREFTNGMRVSVDPVAGTAPPIA